MPEVESLALLTDTSVKQLFAQDFLQLLKYQGVNAHLFSIPVGERSKTRAQKSAIEDAMLEAGLGRECTVVGMGGGVVTDLAGFVAATYCRGVPYIAIPTTLLGQVDASLGGKVGVNTPHGKNLVGAFYPARLIVIDPEVLQSLPVQEWRNGMAEVLKYGLIASRALFEQRMSVEKSIEMCCRIKERIVAADLHESGLRRILNFGHTVGHALESALGYALPHGEAVALGLWVESTLSMLLGQLARASCQEIHRRLEEQGFPFVWPSVDRELFFRHMQRDKKSAGGEIRCVLLAEIGEVASFGGAFCTPVSQESIEEAVIWLSSK